MSDEKPTTKKRGRPPGIKSPHGAKTVKPQLQYRQVISMSEAIRRRIDPDLILKYHTYVVAGINPVWVLDEDGTPVDVKPDPSQLAMTPDLARKSESLKTIMAYGWGQPVQTTQIDIEMRARIDQMGSGISTQELMGVDPEALKLLQQAFQRARLPAPAKDDAESNVIDAEFTDVNENSPPLDTSSTTLTEIKDDTTSSKDGPDSNKGE